MPGPGGRRSSRRVAGSWRTARWPVAIGAWLVVGLISLPGLVSAVDLGSTHLGVVRQVSGSVSLVNFDGSAFCLDTDATGEQLCSAPYQLPGSPPLAVGQHVSGTVIRVARGDGSVEIFLITDPAPNP